MACYIPAPGQTTYNKKRKLCKETNILLAKNWDIEKNVLHRNSQALLCQHQFYPWGNSGPMVPQSLWVTFSIGSQLVNFLVNWGFTFGITKAPGPLTNQTMEVLGAIREVRKYKWMTEWTVNLGKRMVTHSFIIIPKYLFPLQERDFLNKLQATILCLGGIPVTSREPNQSFDHHLSPE